MALRLSEGLGLGERTYDRPVNG
ncbi:hypothetical protein RA210_U340001 [Rubrivivax sp. A210]|nr:hypothetical protein RA210_U340001 [Rubrivivax sp. A210]